MDNIYKTKLPPDFIYRTNPIEPFYNKEARKTFDSLSEWQETQLKGILKILRHEYSPKTDFKKLRHSSFEHQIDYNVWKLKCRVDAYIRDPANATRGFVGLHGEQIFLDDELNKIIARRQMKLLIVNWEVYEALTDPNK